MTPTDEMILAQPFNPAWVNDPSKREIVERRMEALNRLRQRRAAEKAYREAREQVRIEGFAETERGTRLNKLAKSRKTRAKQKASRRKNRGAA